MKTLTATVNTEKDANQGAWCELYDFYLRTPIVTPWGTIDTLRLTSLPDGFQFFTPQLDPEPAGTRGNAMLYNYWPLKRDRLKVDAGSANDRMVIVASNVTTEFAAMVEAVDWQDTPVVIRKVPLKLTGLTASDCAILAIGLLDAPEEITNEQLQFALHNDLTAFGTTLPRETMHQNCRFRWGDDQCTVVRLLQENYKSKTVGSGSTTTTVVSTGLTEDTGSDSSYGTELVNPLANGNITASSQETGFEGYRVKSSDSGHWRWSGAATNWGDNIQGYWVIPSGKEGLANHLLGPFLQIDFGSAKTPKLWRVSGLGGKGREVLPRLILFFSSTDSATWKHETYFEMPPKGGVLYDVLIPKAQTARYWRICVRTKWSEAPLLPMFTQVEAYEESRHWWADGQITFATNTTTVALRGVSRMVRESYSGKVVVAALPVAPVSGDTFVIERGCSKNFNACCARLNWENFGGFDSMIYELVADAGGLYGGSGAGGDGGAGGGGRYQPF